jgi:hypothetical protein
LSQKYVKSKTPTKKGANMAKIARGTIVFEYNLSEEPYPERYADMSQEEIIRELVSEMVEDVIHLSYSDLGPAIEMEIVEV